jgi:hypothetical protein
MKNLPMTLAAFFLATIWIGIAVADQNQGENTPRPPLGNNPHPITWGGQPSKPSQPAVQSPAGKQGDHADRGRSAESTGHASSSGGYAPYLGGPYVWDPYYGSYRYPYGYLPLNDSYLPPVYFPSDEFYGPRAVQRLLGADSQSRPGADVNIIQRPLRDDDEAPEPKKGAQRGTNAHALAMAWRYIGFGDARFAEQRYSEASQRYHTASGDAPQLADAWFRQGFAFIAEGRYDQAAIAMKRGLKLNPNWAKSDFNLKDLYGPDVLAKKAHRDVLAEAAEARPNDPDLLFLLGVHLYFDGQADRAAAFFNRANEIAGPNAEHLRAFVAK